MENQLTNEPTNYPTITLHCIREDRQRETTKLTHHSLSDAHELAKWVLHIGNGLYTEIEIRTENGTIETIQNPAVAHPVGSR